MLEWNAKSWRDNQVCLSYGRADTLFPPERAIIQHLIEICGDGRILDLGVGGGRTTPHLLQISADYIGVDYSPAMIEVCRQRFPGSNFAVGDARALSNFDNDQFDLVMFSFNGIDNLDHNDRLQSLAEVRRVLRSGGTFVFSSHNRYRSQIVEPWSLAHFGFADNPTLNPLKLARRVARYGTGIINHLSLRSRQIQTDEYAIINDSGDQYRFLSYHICAGRQIEQLTRAGFCVTAMYDVDGRKLDAETASHPSDSWMIYYVCTCAGTD